MCQRIPKVHTLRVSVEAQDHYSNQVAILVWKTIPFDV